MSLEEGWTAKQRPAQDDAADLDRAAQATTASEARALLLSTEASVLEEFVGYSDRRSHGERVVNGQHLMQASSDIFLGWDRAPGVDGIELARRVSEQQPGIKIMFITGFAAVAMQDDSIGPNRPKVLAKPFHLRHLIDEIEHLMTQ